MLMSGVNGERGLADARGTCDRGDRHRPAERVVAFVDPSVEPAKRCVTTGESVCVDGELLRNRPPLYRAVGTGVCVGLRTWSGPPLQYLAWRTAAATAGLTGLGMLVAPQRLWGLGHHIGHQPGLTSAVTVPQSPAH